MAREHRFIILLDDAERDALDALARVEKLPASTLVRRRMLFEAELRGCFVAGKANRAGEVCETVPNAIAA